MIRFCYTLLLTLFLFIFIVTVVVLLLLLEWVSSAHWHGRELGARWLVASRSSGISSSSGSSSEGLCVAGGRSAPEGDFLLFEVAAVLLVDEDEVEEVLDREL